MLLLRQARDLLHVENEEEASREAEPREDVESGLLTQAVQEEVGAGRHDEDAGPEHDTSHRVGGVCCHNGRIEPEERALGCLVARQKGENEECGAQRAVQSDAYRYTELAEPHCKLPADKDCLHSKAFAQQGRDQASDELEDANEG